VGGQAAQRVAVRGADRDAAIRVGGLRVVPVQDVVQQVRAVRVDLPRQRGHGQVEGLPVAAHHLMGQGHPAPAGQVTAGQLTAAEPQPVPPGAAQVGVVLAPPPGQLADAGIGVHQFRPQRRDLLGQALHEPHVPRAEPGIRHDGSFPDSQHAGRLVFASRRLGR
jgi:hypothetical protein